MVLYCDVKSRKGFVLWGKVKFSNGIVKWRVETVTCGSVMNGIAM